MNRKHIPMESDPMWIASGCSECGEMLYIRLRSDESQFERYECSCDRMWKEIQSLQWEMWWDSQEGQRHAAVLSQIADERRLTTDKGWA